jgi:hypothetical protein
LWAPETENQKVQIIYTIWSYFYRWFFLYAYTAALILFIIKVENLSVGQLTIASWAIAPFTEPQMHLPLAAYYPFSIENRWVFALVYFYQIFGVSMNACMNGALDTISSAMILHANGLVKRLGIMLTKVR